MKRFFLFNLLFAVLTAHAQKKVAFSILIDYHTSFLSNTNIYLKTLEHSEESRTNDTITLNKRLFNHTINSSYTTKPRFLIGGRISLKLSETFTLIGGIGISTFNATRNNSSSAKLISIQQVKGSYTYNPPNTLPLYTINFPLERTGYESLASYYFEAKQEKIEFTTISFPFGFLFHSNKNKFNAGIEMIPDLIQKYKVTPSTLIGAEGNQLDAFSKEKKPNLSVRISIGYQINKYLSSNIYYQQFFNSLTEGKANLEMIPKIVGITLIAKLPPLNK